MYTHMLCYAILHYIASDAAFPAIARSRSLGGRQRDIYIYIYIHRHFGHFQYEHFGHFQYDIYIYIYIYAYIYIYIYIDISNISNTAIFHIKNCQTKNL